MVCFSSMSSSRRRGRLGLLPWESIYWITVMIEPLKKRIQCAFTISISLGTTLWENKPNSETVIMRKNFENERERAFSLSIFQNDFGIRFQRIHSRRLRLSVQITTDNDYRRHDWDLKNGFSAYQRTSLNIDGSEVRLDGIIFTLIRYAKIWWTHHGFDKLTGSRRRGFPMSAIGRINLKLYHSVEWTIDESFISCKSRYMRNSCKGRDTSYSWGIENRYIR